MPHAREHATANDFAGCVSYTIIDSLMPMDLHCRINGPVANALYSSTDKSLFSWTGGASFTPHSMQGGCGRNFAQVPAAVATGTAAAVLAPTIYLVQANSTTNPNDAVNAGAWYAVGSYNLSSNTFLPTVSGHTPMALDFGETFCNEFGSDDPGRQGGARLLWLGNFAARDNNHTLTTVVRSVTFDHELQLLLSEPVEELKHLRTKDTILSKSFKGLVGGAAKRQALLNASQLPQRQQRQAGAKAVETMGYAPSEAFDLELNLTIPKRNTASFKPISVGVTVLEFPDAPSAFAIGGVSVVITIVSPAQALMEVGTIHPTSRSWFRAPGAVEQRLSLPMNHTFPIKSDETTLGLRLLVDHLSVEAFAGNGRSVASSLLR